LQTNIRQATKPAFSVNSFFSFFRLNLSQNGFGCRVLIDLARGVNNHLGVMRSRRRRDSRRYMPAKPEKERTGDAVRLAVY
jgi:hypothetical protein